MVGRRLTTDHYRSAIRVLTLEPGGQTCSAVHLRGAQIPESRCGRNPFSDLADVGIITAESAATSLHEGWKERPSASSLALTWWTLRGETASILRVRGKQPNPARVPPLTPGRGKRARYLNAPPRPTSSVWPSAIPQRAQPIPPLPDSLWGPGVHTCRFNEKATASGGTGEGSRGQGISWTRSCRLFLIFPLCHRRALGALRPGGGAFVEQGTSNPSSQYVANLATRRPRLQPYSCQAPPDCTDSRPEPRP
jgi:hypothetical protein